MLTIKLNRLGLKPGMRVLDLGCGEGRHVHGLAMLEGLFVVGFDIDLTSLQKARSGLDYLREIANGPKSDSTFLAGSAYSLPFASNSFDAIVCSEVLEHLEFYPKAIDEIRRVLKPTGKLAISVPHAWPERVCWRLAPPPNGYPFEPGGHIRIFDDTALKLEFENSGFCSTGRHHSHGIHSPLWWLKCASWDRRDSHPLVRAYHSFLVWDIMKKPLLTRALDKLLSPVMGKSVVMYFDAPSATPTDHR